MTSRGSTTTSLNLTQIVINSDLDMPAAKKIKVDHITEQTGSGGVIFDNTAKFTTISEPSAGAGINQIGRIFPTANSAAGTVICSRILFYNVQAYFIARRAGVYSFRINVPDYAPFSDQTGKFMNVVVNGTVNELTGCAKGAVGTTVNITLAAGDVFWYENVDMSGRLFVEMMNQDGMW